MKRMERRRKGRRMKALTLQPDTPNHIPSHIAHHTLPVSFLHTNVMWMLSLHLTLLGAPDL
jgi:hypothetical protein